MADAVAALTKAFVLITTSKLSTTEIKRTGLPANAAAAFKKLESDLSIPTDDSDTSVTFLHTSFAHTGLSDTYSADYSGDDPDMFRIFAVVQDGVVLGSSADVGG